MTAPRSTEQSEDRSPESEIQSDPSGREARRERETKIRESHEGRVPKEREEERKITEAHVTAPYNTRLCTGGFITKPKRFDDYVCT